VAVLKSPFIAAEPLIGSRIAVIEQSFEVLERKEFRRRDGSTGVMLSLESACATCGATYRTSAAVGANGATRRCKAHRQPGTQVRAGRKHRLSVVVLPPEARS
jgi:hypothetical protein